MSSKQQSRSGSSQKLSHPLQDVKPPMTSEEIQSVLLASQKVSLQTVSFMEAFCRRNLSVDEIAIIGVFIDAAFTNPDTTTHEYLQQLLEQNSSIVRFAPRGAQESAHQIADATIAVNR